MRATDLTAVSASAVEGARDDMSRSLGEAGAWVEYLRAGAPGATGCVVCGSLAPTEGHHVAGRHNADLIVPVCPVCHRRLSERQGGWDPRWIRSGNSPSLRESLLLRGLSDLCEERGRFETGYHALGKRLRARYARLAREAGS